MSRLPGLSICLDLLFYSGVKAASNAEESESDTERCQDKNRAQEGEAFLMGSEVGSTPLLPDPEASEDNARIRTRSRAAPH